MAVVLVAGLGHVEYTIQPRDTLEVIAERHGTTVSALAGHNAIGDPNRIVAGRRLQIPARGAAGPADGARHVVQPGETLSLIALRHGVSVARLAEWNGLADGDFVRAGARISLSGPAAPDLATSRGGIHRVAAGETLSGIAGRAGVSVAEIARANQLADPDRIVAGTTLTIPGGWHCPVRGPVTFVNDFGVVKPDGRFHNGIDLYAPRGTAVVAPVAGVVRHETGARAGRQFRLLGVDGHVYIGTHLDSFGASGQVGQGDVLGTVGTSGNAHGTSPHLHFEIHGEGERLLNPYPTLRSACG